MSVQEDIGSLEQTVVRGTARAADLEAMTRASRLMREAADILLRVSSEETARAADLLADACVVLAGPKAEGEEDA